VATGQTEDPREALFHGGFGCLVEFDGDTERID
jgi:uronate dehydrogenase